VGVVWVFCCLAPTLHTITHSFYDKKIMTSTLFRELVMNGRHRHILLICCVQYCLDLKPEIRSQLDLVISTRENLTSIRARLYEHYFGFFRSQKEFERAFDAATDKFGAMCVSNASSSNQLSDHIFWFRAPWPPTKFQLGRSFTFALDRELARDPDDAQELEVEDSSQLVQMCMEDGVSAVDLT